MPDFDTRQPQEPDEPNGLRSRSLTHGLRNLVTAHGLRTLLISGGILLFVVVAVSMLAGRSYYGSVNRSPSPSVETKEPDRGAPTQPCEGIDPDGIRNGKIAFDLADEAVPVAQDPKRDGHRCTGYLDRKPERLGPGQPHDELEGLGLRRNPGLVARRPTVSLREAEYELCGREKKASRPTDWPRRATS